MAKIAVGGCSFSDRRYGITPWGDTVAKHFNKEYIHEAASAGSNHRMWRTLTQHIMQGNLSKGDTIIMQYTLMDRKESWTPELHENTGQESISEPYDGGTLIRLTPHFDQFAIGNYEKHLADCHVYFNNHKYNKELFETQHYMFASMCRRHKIQLRILNTVYDSDCRIKDIDAVDILKRPNHRLDASHLNQLGHDKLAQIVINQM